MPVRTNTDGETIRAFFFYRKPLTICVMQPEGITLPRQVRQYFAEIGRRGGHAGRRELASTSAADGGDPRSQARHEEERRTRPKLSRKDQHILRGRP